MRAIWVNDNARKRSRAYGYHNLSPIEALAVLERDGWRCRQCGIPTPRDRRGTKAPDAPEVDHVVPLCAGGTNDPANLQCLCKRCNQAKGGRRAPTEAPAANNHARAA